MNLLKCLEPKFNTLIQAAVIAILLVVISYVYDREDKASAHMRTVASTLR